MQSSSVSRAIHRLGRGTGTALGVVLILASAPVASATLDAKLAGFAALQDDELDTMRAGFVGRLTASIGFDIANFVNGTPMGQVTISPVTFGNGQPTPANVAVNGTPVGALNGAPLTITHAANGGATVSSLTVGNGFILNTVQNSIDSQVIRTVVTANIEVFGLSDMVRSHAQQLRMLDVARSGSLGRR